LSTWVGVLTYLTCSAKYIARPFLHKKQNIAECIYKKNFLNSVAFEEERDVSYAPNDVIALAKQRTTNSVDWTADHVPC
jgi:hypothetical protein